MLVRVVAAAVCDQFRSVLGDRSRQRTLDLDDDGFLRQFLHPRVSSCARFVMLFTAILNLLLSNIVEANLFRLGVSRNVGRMSPATAR
ncbi:hypothetical protein Dvina_07785 [Dactylosporangium vinaceum]|uniref:Uncharacterized protein n=1 Tax=Dactylosporangium vinaceum TaxID=53362 RepID=A0ABV5M7C2_9ACTN|nr:hypothetical protein [Dactylosporangium vinaceum]UAB97996.1 hypothetical protein Dvina_07785 [Dactylosporangium vinaceum]